MVAGGKKEGWSHGVTSQWLISGHAENDIIALHPPQNVSATRQTFMQDPALPSEAYTT
jgi:hypothetical protein